MATVCRLYLKGYVRSTKYSIPSTFCRSSRQAWPGSSQEWVFHVDSRVRLRIFKCNSWSICQTEARHDACCDVHIWDGCLVDCADQPGGVRNALIYINFDSGGCGFRVMMLASSQWQKQGRAPTNVYSLNMSYGTQIARHFCTIWMPDTDYTYTAAVAARHQLLL